MRRILSIILPVVLLAMGCSSTEFPERFQKRSEVIESFVLRTKGEAGQRFIATLTIDGRKREISGVSPAQYPLQANVLVGTIEKLDGDGTLGFEIVMPGSLMAFAALERVGDFCWFRYHARGIEVMQGMK